MDDVFSGKEAAIVIEANNKPDYREKLNAELKNYSKVSCGKPVCKSEN